MATASADRNLLFGILALQLDFISRDQLVAAMQAWVLEKTTPLGEVLLRQGALGADRLALLDALVKSHLALHGNDPHQSLAALSVVSSVKAMLAPAVDNELHQTLAFVPATVAYRRPPQKETQDGGDDPDSTVAPDAVSQASEAAGQASASGDRFRILRPHREGGLGEVVVAFDGELHREVALKKIKDRHADNADARARFVREGEITGKLEHPGIVPIYSLGHYAGGQPFYAMRFIKGDSLEDAISQFHKADAELRSESERTMELRKLLGRFVDVCEAISYAHSRGVLHRDLKPGNIMLGKYGETLVVDWGLAKAQGEAEPEGGTQTHASASLAPVKVASGSGSNATEMGSVLGTPAYMPPEQAEGRLGELGPASDVYSLGATLYALLTGHSPIEGERNVGLILMRVSAGEIPPPRQVNAKVPAALEAVCCKAMALKPENRYATAQELADEVERWLADEPVRAWPEPRAVCARRWMRRHRAVVTGAAAAVLVGVLSLVGISFILAERNQKLHDANDAVSRQEQETRLANENLKSANAAVSRQEQETRLANAQLKSANADVEKASREIQTANHKLDREKRIAEENLASTTMTLARSRFEENNAGLADDLLEQIPARYRGSAWGLLKNYVAGSLFTFYGHTHSVVSVSYSPDGQAVASASQDATVRLWDAKTGQERCVLKAHSSFVWSVCYSPDGQTLASASEDQTVRLWDAKTGQELHVLKGHAAPVCSVSYSPDGQTLASASHDQTVRLWDAKTGQERCVLKGHTHAVQSVSCSPDGQTVASASHDHTVRLWDAKTGQEQRVLNGHAQQVYGVCYSPDGQTLASASADQTVRLWDAKTGRQLRVLKGHTDFVTSVSYSPDSQALASASWDQTVRLWNAKTGQELYAFKGHSNYVSSVSYSPDGQTVASASEDQTVRLWDAKTDHGLRVLKGHTNFVSSVSYSPDGQALASASWDQTVRLWNAKTGLETRVLKGHTDLVQSVSYSPDGQTLASASADQTARLWDAKTGQQLRILKGHTDFVTSVSYSPDAKTLASASWDQTVRLWDPKTGLELRVLKGHSGKVMSVSHSPDGQTLASASEDQTVRLWDAKTGQQLRVLKGNTGPVLSVSYSSDGKTLASANGDQTVRLWDVKTGLEVRALKGHANQVNSVSYSPDGQTLASASADKTVRLWDAKTGQQLRVLKGHSSFVMCVIYSPDGQILATASRDRRLRLWNAKTDQGLHVLKGHNSFVNTVGYSPDGQTLASASADQTVRLWDAKTGLERHILTGHTGAVLSVSYSLDGQDIWSRAMDRKVLGWKVQNGAPCDEVPEGLDFSSSRGASSPDGKTFALGTDRGNILLVPRSPSPAELSYRLWVTSPDLQWHKDQMEQLQKTDPAAAAFHLGWYLASQDYYAAQKEQPAAPPSLHSAILSRGRLWAGLLQKTAGPALAPLLAEAARDAAQPNVPWQSHALYGAALYRAGDGSKALQELTLALKQRGQRNVWLSAFLAMTYAQLGETAKAKEWLSKLAPPADAAWEEQALAALLSPEADATVAALNPGKNNGLREAH